MRLLLDSRRAWKYLSCVLVGTPMFFFIVLLSTLAPEVGKALHLTEDLVAAKALLYYAIGITLGDLASGLLSQYLGSRKRAIAIFLFGAAIFSSAILFGEGRSSTYYYSLLLPGGFCIGYWCVLITTSAEQFGTNLRSTVASTVPNFVRGMTIPITFLFQFLRPELGTVGAIKSVGLLCFSLAAVGLYSLKETFATDLDFLELKNPANIPPPTDEQDEPALVANM